MKNAWKISGWYLLTVGIIHNLYGILSIIFSLRNEELMSQIEQAFDLQAAGVSGQMYVIGQMFWFVFLGFFLIYLGVQWQGQIKRLQEPLSKFAAWGLTVLTIPGLFFVPTSGLWLFLPLCFIMLYPHYLAKKQ